MPLNKIFPEPDEYTELDHLYELKSLQEDLLREEIDPPQFEAPDWDKRQARDFAEALKRDNKGRVPIWVTRPQKELLNRFFKKQKPRAERAVWRDIANALVVSGIRTSEDIKEMVDLCDQGYINKDLYFTDVLRIELRKRG